MSAMPEVEHYPAANCVMVVEDDALIRMVIADSLRDAGLRVIEANSGAEAISYLTSGAQVDLIFSDIQMDGPLDGLNLARHARQLYPAMPVLLTSGSGKPAELGKADNFVAKPYEHDHVVALIMTALAGVETK